MEARRSKLRTHIEALNEQYAGWVKRESDEHCLELWIDGAKQYINHAEKLLADFRDLEADNSRERAGSGDKAVSLNGEVKENGQSEESLLAAQAPSTSFGGFSWSAEPQEKKAEPSLFVPAFLQNSSGFSFGKDNASSAPFSFGQSGTSRKEEASSSRGFGLKSKPPEKEGPEQGKDSAGKPNFTFSPAPFSFGTASTSAAFSFGSGDASGGKSLNPNAAPFGDLKFGEAPSTSAAPLSSTANPFSSLAPGDGGDREDAEDEAQPEEAAEPLGREADPSADVIFEDKVTLHIQSTGADKGWVNKGRGVLTVRRPKEGSGRPFIVVASNTGNIMLNASIQEGIKPVEKDKNRVMMTLFWAKDGSTDSQGHFVLFKLDSPEQLKAFISSIGSAAKE